MLARLPAVAPVPAKSKLDTVCVVPAAKVSEAPAKVLVMLLKVFEPLMVKVDDPVLPMLRL